LNPFCKEIEMLSATQIAQFEHDGFLVLSACASTEFCQQVLAYVETELAQIQQKSQQLQHLQQSQQTQLVEYEVDTRYPGAPRSRDEEGGLTVRRLLQAYARDPLFQTWVAHAPVRQALGQLLGSPFYLSQAHHNCIMTKHPRYSSRTGWHRDSRYWNFQRAQLISVWLALRDEVVENGCLWVIPGSHHWHLNAEQFDDAQFLREDLAENQVLLKQAQSVALQAGDVLLFHSNLFHAAGANHTNATKFSLVMTYRAQDNVAIAGSRSARLPEIELSMN
jgi:phytanoyl-CoA hydroxylase